MCHSAHCTAPRNQCAQMAAAKRHVATRNWRRGIPPTSERAQLMKATAPVRATYPAPSVDRPAKKRCGAICAHRVKTNKPIVFKASGQTNKAIAWKTLQLQNQRSKTPLSQRWQPCGAWAEAGHLGCSVALFCACATKPVLMTLALLMRQLCVCVGDVASRSSCCFCFTLHVNRIPVIRIKIHVSIRVRTVKTRV